MRRIASLVQNLHAHSSLANGVCIWVHSEHVIYRVGQSCTQIIQLHHFAFGLVDGEEPLFQLFKLRPDFGRHLFDQVV